MLYEGRDKSGYELSVCELCCIVASIVIIINVSKNFQFRFIVVWNVSEFLHL